jgi:hypothetical protein
VDLIAIIHKQLNGSVHLFDLAKLMGLVENEIIRFIFDMLPIHCVGLANIQWSVEKNVAGDGFADAHNGTVKIGQDHNIATSNLRNYHNEDVSDIEDVGNSWGNIEVDFDKKADIDTTFCNKILNLLIYYLKYYEKANK